MQSAFYHSNFFLACPLCFPGSVVKTQCTARTKGKCKSCLTGINYSPLHILSIQSPQSCINCDTLSNNICPEGQEMKNICNKVG